MTILGTFWITLPQAKRSSPRKMLPGKAMAVVEAGVNLVCRADQCRRTSRCNFQGLSWQWLETVGRPPFMQQKLIRCLVDQRNSTTGRPSHRVRGEDRAP